MTTNSSGNVPRLITYLIGLQNSNDRASLAALRRGLGKPSGTVPEMYPHVEPNIPAQRSREYEEAAYLVASLFGSHPMNLSSVPDRLWETNFGSSYRKLRNISNNPDSIERRFSELLTKEPEALHEHLRHSMSLLKGSSIPIDWTQLIRDLTRWRNPDKRVQRSWARSFWQRTVPTGDEQSPEANSELQLDNLDDSAFEGS